jgi:hypothetical protein
MALGRRRPAGAAPGVEADVVVAARREEGRLDVPLVRAVHGDIEAQYVMGIVRGAPEIGDPQVRVADAHLRVDGFAHDVLLTLIARGLLPAPALLVADVSRPLAQTYRPPPSGGVAGCVTIRPSLLPPDQATIRT